MTYGEIFRLFNQRYPDVKVSDYRPAGMGPDQTLGMHCIGPKVGIIVWTEDDDIIIFFPKELNLL